jgi:hypothetical protein
VADTIEWLKRKWSQEWGLHRDGVERIEAYLEQCEYARLKRQSNEEPM